MDDGSLNVNQEYNNSIDPYHTASRKRKLERILLLEDVYSTTVQIIIVDMAWACAGLTSTAILYSIDKGKINEYAGAWIYFFIALITVIVVSFLPRTFRSFGSETLREKIRNVLRSHAKQKAIEEEIMQKQHKTDATAVDNTVVPTEPANKNTKLLINNAVHIVETQTSEISRNTVTLMLIVAGNVLASALNNVVQLTAQKSFESIGGSTLIMLWLYAIFVCIFGTIAAVKLAEFVGNNTGYDVVKIVEKEEYVELKHDLLTLSHTLRMYRLCAVAISLCMAWSVRDAVKYTIMEIFYDTYQTDDGTRQAVLGLWIYTLFSAMVVTGINMLLERKGYITQHHLDFSKFVRKETQLAAYLTFNVFQAVVGLALYDALIGSFEHGSTTGVRLTVYWTVVIVCMTLSVTGTYYWESYQHMYNQKPLYQAIANEDSSSRGSDEMHDVQHAYMSQHKKSLIKEYGRNWVDVWIRAIGIAGSLAGANAVAFSLVAIYGGVYDPTAPHDPNKNEVWSLWLAVLIIYIVSALVLTYLSQSMTMVKKKKRKYAQKILLTQKLSKKTVDLIEK